MSLSVGYVCSLSGSEGTFVKAPTVMMMMNVCGGGRALGAWVMHSLTHAHAWVLFSFIFWYLFRLFFLAAFFSNVNFDASRCIRPKKKRMKSQCAIQRNRLAVASLTDRQDFGCLSATVLYCIVGTTSHVMPESRSVHIHAAWIKCDACYCSTKNKMKMKIKGVL